MGKKRDRTRIKAMMQKKILTTLMGCQGRTLNVPKQTKQKAEPYKYIEMKPEQSISSVISGYHSKTTLLNKTVNGV